MSSTDSLQVMENSVRTDSQDTIAQWHHETDASTVNTGSGSAAPKQDYRLSKDLKRPAHYRECLLLTCHDFKVINAA